MIWINKRIPSKGFIAMAQYPIIFVRKEKVKKFTGQVERHEKFHYVQQKGISLIVFDIWYCIEWFIRLFMEGRAYKNISFEREVRANLNDPNYLKNRKRHSFLKYL